MRSLNAEATLSAVHLNPVKDLTTLSDIADTELSEIARAPVKSLPTTLEGTTLTSGNLPAPLLMLSLNAEATLSAVLRNAVKVLVTLSDTADNEFSEIARAPVKTLPRTSEGTTLSSGNFAVALPIESAIETTTDRDLATPLFTTSEIIDARFSDVVLNPVKTLDAASDTVGASASVLNPVKTLPRTSEGTRLRSGNFPAPLLTEAAIAEARFSDVLLNPVKALITLSDIADNEFSEIARAPVKTLPRTSEGTKLSSGNFPAPLLTETAIVKPSDGDVLLNPFKSLATLSDIADTEFSEITRAPVKTLPRTSEGTTLSSAN